MAILCWARRGGKDYTAFGYALREMITKPMNVVLVFPTKEQGMKSFWNNVENDGFKTIDRFPKSLIARQDNNNMRVVLKNGSVFEVLGTTDPDALRGANGKIYILSEFVDHPGAVLDIIRPVVAANNGQILIISTPKIDGISGQTFEALFNRALKNWQSGKKTQYASVITAREYLSEETLEELRQQSIIEHGNDFFWRQEYLCDFGQVSATTYYGGVLHLAEKNGYIGDYPYEKAHPVYTAWDLGMSDSTAITMFQYIKKQPRIIDFFETNDVGLEAIIRYVTAKPYNFGWHFLPHDGSVRDSDAVSRLQKARDLGLINSSTLIRESVEAGIERAVTNISRTEFNEATTTELRRKLRLYKRKWNPVTGNYVGPDHKTESHAADSVRYVYAAIEQMFDKQTGEFLHSPANAQDTYETDQIFTPGLYHPA